MNDRAASALTHSKEDHAGIGQVSAGTMLRKAREEAGLHIAALAVSLKVPVKKIEALENDRIDLLPDAVFARALASSVCRSLKIDPKSILSALPPTPVLSSLSGGDSRKVSFRDSGQSAQKSFVPQLSRPLMWVGLFLAMAAVMMMVYPVLEQMILKDEKTESKVAGVFGTPKNADLPSTSALTSTSSSTLAPALTSPASSSALNVEANPVISVPPTASASSVSSIGLPIAGPTANAPTDAAASGADDKSVLTLKSRASSWVEVIDSNGLVQLRKTMSEGESLSLSGPLPLKVVVGRADSIDVFVRNRPLSLVSLTKDNIARFEVK